MWELIMGIIGTLLAILFGRSILRGKRPKSPEPNDQGAGRAVDSLAGAARTEAARASETRGKADEEILKDVLSRPATDDAVADLRARLGHRARTFPTNRNGPGEPHP